MITVQKAKERILSNLKINEKDFTKSLIPDNALSFLVTWTIFESKCCNCDATMKKFVELNYKSDNQSNIDECFYHFSERYKNDEEKLRKLRFYSKKNKMMFKEMITKKTATYDEKLKVCLMTLIRYRNNIFHGNKHPLYWNYYKTEFNLLIEFMLDMIENGYELEYA